MPGEELKYTYIDFETLNGELDKQTAQLKRYVDAEVIHIKDLFELYNRMAKEAVDKALQTSDKRFDLTNEFRAQLNDTLATRASREETNLAVSGLTVKQVNFETMIMDKINTTAANGLAQVIAMKSEAESKRDALFKNLEDRIIASQKSESERFHAVDMTIDTKINANADISNKGISDNAKSINAINLWRESIIARQAVTDRIMGFILAIMSALIIHALTVIFK